MHFIRGWIFGEIVRLLTEIMLENKLRDTSPKEGALGKTTQESTENIP
jgi:hypothetical protein